MNWDDLKIPFLISAIVIFLISLYTFVLRGWRNKAKVGEFPFLYSLDSRLISDSLSISYELPQDDSVLINILDSSENQVIKVVDEIKRPGKYQVDLDVSGLSKGNYYYQLETSNHKSTKKFEKV